MMEGGFKFNKMMVMLPCMFLVRKLDGEDPVTVHWLRIAYGVVQGLCLILVAYVYLTASSVQSQKVVYVPAPPVPFSDPATAKKKYTEISYGKHVLNTARSLLGSTLFGLAMTLGLHYYKGMIMGLAMQAVMGPLNLYENALVQAVVTGKGISMANRIFEELTAAELTGQEEVVDEQGNAVVRAGTSTPAAAALTNTSAASTQKSLEDVLLDTWDGGAKADISELMKTLTKKNCNYQTKEDHWTALMILSGLCAKGTAGAIRQVKEMGGNLAILDKEGWNCLHWAAFHGSVAAAKELAKETHLMSVKDKEGLTPLETARKEGNDQVAAIFEEALGESKKSK